MSAALTAILAVLKLLPDLLSLLKELFSLIKKKMEDDPKKFVRDAGDGFKQLNQAKTQEEKLNAAKKLQDLLSRT